MLTAVILLLCPRVTTTPTALKKVVYAKTSGRKGIYARTQQEGCFPSRFASNGLNPTWTIYSCKGQ